MDLAATAAQRKLDRQVPDVECKGLCVDGCGAIGMTERELARLQQAAGRPLPVAGTVDTPTGPKPFLAPGPDGHCVLLVDGRCTVYKARPMVCRLWGATAALPCPWGCTPAGGLLLDEDTARRLLLGMDDAVPVNPPRRRTTTPGYDTGEQ